MPKIILFEDAHAKNLYPFHLIEGVEEIRHGAFTQRERWQHAGFILDDNRSHTELHINARWIPTAKAVKALSDMPANAVLLHGDTVLASTESLEKTAGLNPHQIQAEPELLDHANTLFSGLEQQLLADLPRLQTDWTLSPLAATPPTHIFGPSCDVLVAQSATIKAATIDTTKGPVVIGPGAILEAGCHIEGPVLIHANATVKMGACIKGATVIGPHCKVGGEVSNVHFQGWANKGHDGFLGNSVIGRWCNLGAGTNSSNLKNTYGDVRQWSFATHEMDNTGLQFCGLLMGDHAKCGIGTTFNTGTVVGPASVIFDAGFPPKHVPAFSWVNAKTGETQIQDLQKMMATADKVMTRRTVAMTTKAKANLSDLHATRSNAT